jgi:hypothetical protein
MQGKPNRNQGNGNKLFRLFEIQTQGIYTVALPCGCRTIVEKMTEMSPAIGAYYFYADHSVTGVFDFFDLSSGNFTVETGPAAMRVKLHIAFEQLGSAARTGISALLKIFLNEAFLCLFHVKCNTAGDSVCFSILLPKDWPGFCLLA